MSHGPITVRPAEARDVPAVAALVREVLAEHGLSFGEGSATDAQVLALPGSYGDHGGMFWVAVDARGALLGTCGVFPLGAGDHELRKMYLRPAARGTGLARRLLDLAVAHARAMGGARLVLDTAATMTRAMAFYEANGFVRDDTQRRGARCDRGYARALCSETPRRDRV